MISSFLVLSLTFGGGGTGARGGAVPGPVPGWEQTSYAAHHTPDDLHMYMNGGAAKYLAYSIQELHVQEYTRGSDGFLAVLELYRMDSPRNAFGVYSSDRKGTHPPGTWQEATYGAGLLQFWKGLYYVRIQAAEPSEESKQGVLDLGSAVSRAIGSWDPTGAAPAPSLPALAASMPADSLVEDSLCFFHNQVSLNSIYYLSDENLLKLDLETDAVSALYRMEGGTSARVIAVCYPDSETAKSAHDAFRNAHQDPPSDEAKKNDLGRQNAGGGETGGNETENDPMPSESVCIAIDGRTLAIVLQAPTRESAEKLCARVLAAAECAKEEKQ